MQRSSVRLLLAALAGLAACSEANPVDVRSQGTEFPVMATWSAAATTVSPSTVSGALTVTQHLGARMDATFTLIGAPGKTYQWRIFRGDCASNVAAATSTSATGLLIVATIQSYPDIAADNSGKGAAISTVAWTLDSLTAYSVRVRLSQTSTNWNGTSPVACGNLQRSAGS